MDRTWTRVQNQYRMLVQWLSALLTKSFHEKAGVSQVCIFFLHFPSRRGAVRENLRGHQVIAQTAEVMTSSARPGGLQGGVFLTLVCMGSIVMSS
jgi:hypothetical protein